MSVYRAVLERAWRANPAWEPTIAGMEGACYRALRPVLAPADRAPHSSYQGVVWKHRVAHAYAQLKHDGLIEKTRDPRGEAYFYWTGAPLA